MTGKNKVGQTAHFFYCRQTMTCRMACGRCLDPGQDPHRTTMDRTAELAGLLAPTLEGMGYLLVRVQIFGGGRPTLQVMAERRDGRAMSVDDCADISHVLSAKLDVEDPIKGAYSLEVSSPGIDRPLMGPADFRRFAGFDARVETVAKIDGRRKFSGRIVDADAAAVRLAVTDERGGEATVAIPVGDIARAKLTLTDRLIEASRLNALPPPQAAAGAGAPS